jgi:hypothetical protein
MPTLPVLLALGTGPAPVRGEAPALTVTPATRKVKLRVGERREFSVRAVDDHVLCFWRLDRRTIPAALPRWIFAPAPWQVGTHRLEVDVHGRGGAVEHVWIVHVDPPRTPRLVAAAPETPRLEVAADETVELRLEAAPGTPGESVRTTWMLDGVPAGDGETLEVAPPRLGRVRVRALAVGSLGAAVSREWELFVRPSAVVSAAAPRPAAPRTTTPAPEAPAAATTTSTLAMLARGDEPVPPLPRPGAAPSTSVPPPPAPTTTVAPPPAPTTTRPPPPTSSTVVPAGAPTTTLAEALAHASPPEPTTTSTTRPARAAVTTTTRPTAPEPLVEVAVAEPPPLLASLPPTPEPAPPPTARVTRDDVEALLRRYADAWAAGDVEALRHIGQVTTDTQARSLREHFARTPRVEVEIELLEATPDGDAVTVRFRRRDRFRDPIGRVIAKETPAIEKRVERRGGEVRFGGAS